VVALEPDLDSEFDLPLFTAPRTSVNGNGQGLVVTAEPTSNWPKLCMNIWGDAAIGMTGMDFETAARNHIPIMSIVFNNFSMAMELPVMPISDVALAALQSYLDGFRGPRPRSLFRTVQGSPLRHHHMNVMFTRFGLPASVTQVNPHRFRHTFATWAIAASAPRAGRAVPARSLQPDDGASLLRDLRLRAGGGGARLLQPGQPARNLEDLPGIDPGPAGACAWLQQ
jgi:Thiamine pyrophosphate enzyme, C-terminal TPP binding domain/Phage integrase family